MGRQKLSYVDQLEECQSSYTLKNHLIKTLIQKQLLNAEFSPLLVVRNYLFDLPY